jgi:glycosyltransferase involved in cell wall biosynthesis
MSRIKILFNGWADRSNINAQNLNCREIARRMDPRRFEISLFTSDEPDPHLVGRENIRFLRIPGRLGTPVIVRHLLGRYDALLYLRMSRADSIFRRIVQSYKGRKLLVAPVESRQDTCNGTRRFYDELDALADVVVANSPFVAETFRTRYRREPCMIFTGVDTELFRRLSAEARPSNDASTVMFLGSFQEHKQPWIVLDAAKLFPEARFVLLGNGPLKPGLERRAVEERLSNVSFLPARDYEASARELVKADIFLHPSCVEGLPKVTLEAAAAGIPVVAFNDYRTPSVVDGETGFCVDTVSEMMDRLAQLIEDGSLRASMGAAAQEHAKNFDWSLIARQWEELFEHALEG